MGTCDAAPLPPKLAPILAHAVPHNLLLSLAGDSVSPAIAQKTMLNVVLQANRCNCAPVDHDLADLMYACTINNRHAVEQGFQCKQHCHMSCSCRWCVDAATGCIPLLAP